jgi:hypothetical protein
VQSTPITAEHRLKIEQFISLFQASVFFRPVQAVLCESRVPADCSATARYLDTAQDEVDSGEKIDTVVVSAQLCCYAACERILIRIELRPLGRHCVQTIPHLD